MEWFVGDYHFDHANIMRYCHRPFVNVEEMNATLIQNTNDRVGRSDTLYFLGDWSFKNAEKYRKLINCPNIHFIRGNHDREPDRVYKELFTTVRDLNKIKATLDGERIEIVLCHYAMRIWNKSHHGVWHFYAHSHGTLPDWHKSTDVGVDAIAQRLAGIAVGDPAELELCHDQLKPEYYRPTNLREVSELMASKECRSSRTSEA